MSMVQTFYDASDEQIEAVSGSANLYKAFDDFLDEAEQTHENAYIDKSWGGIHFLLTGTDNGGEPPLDFIQYGAKNAIDIGDVGYGLAHAFSSIETRKIDRALREVTAWLIHMRYDPYRMHELGIYPNHWLEDETKRLYDPLSQVERDREQRSYLLAHLKALKRLLRKAARDGKGIVTYRG